MNAQNPKIHRVAIFSNFNIPEKAAAALQVADFLAELDVTVAFHISHRDKIFRMHRHRGNFVYLGTEELYRTADMVAVFGGDGTILEAARYAAPQDVPMLGFNLGRVGYMAELELSEIECLREICEGNYVLDERSMLSVEVMNSARKVRKSSFALNDAVLTNGSMARLVDLELYESGTLLTKYRADGLILSTPSGSTAYSMSAGGSIIDPKLSAICVTPICPYSLISRPIIFSDSSVLEVRNLSKREKMIYLTVDGKINIELYYDDIVRITKSNLRTRLIKYKNTSFYTNLRAKLCTPDFL
ncbi:MAG: NAD(+)/NADH kinase [Clostridia bacterium]|nr:NAD(+)/NADH kinase [Clostridia bacterium]